MFYGRMSSPSTTLLLFYISFFPAIGYKLPFLDESHLSGHIDKSLRKNSSPLGIKWEWATADRVDEFSKLVRVKRKVEDKTSSNGDANSAVTSPLYFSKVSESQMEETSDVTPHILETSNAPLTEAQSMSLLTEYGTTPLTELYQTTKEVKHKLGEVETTHIVDYTLSPTKSEELSVFTNHKPNKVTTVTQVHSTDIQHISSTQTSTNDKLLEDASSSAPTNTPSKPPATLDDLTTGHGSTNEWIPVSSGSSTRPAVVTHLTASSEDIVQTQSLMRQCMLTILILAVVCTVFIITTIALAAKLSTLKQKHKLHHPATYTEMRCISSLLPESEQQGKRLKTFVNDVEETDGDNTTLNSFLPDY